MLRSSGRRALLAVVRASRPSVAVTLLLLAAAPAGAAEPHAIFRRPPGALRAATPPSSVALTVDRAALDGFRAGDAGRLELPVPEGGTLVLDLRRVELLAPGATVTFDDGRGPAPWKGEVAVFRGTVEGEPGSFALLATSAGQVTGRIERAAGPLLVSPLGGPDGAHAVADEAGLPEPTQPLECHLDAPEARGPVAPAGPPALPADLQATTMRLVCDLALDCDYEYFVLEGSDTARAVAYALVLLGTTSSIYERDLNVSLRASYLNIWITADDPYRFGDTETLAEFRNFWMANRSGVPRDLAQLISGRPERFGAAYLATPCDTEWGYTIISGLAGNTVYPSAVTTWDVQVMAHELGHNFKCQHTHSCWWQANGYAPVGALLDSCGTPDGPCYGGPRRRPPDGGTIMSYCSAFGGWQDLHKNMRLAFHPTCSSWMRYVAEHAACIGLPPLQPPSRLVVATGPDGASLAWAPCPHAGVLGYDVHRSAWPQDLAPERIGTTGATSFSDRAIGTFWYKVRAFRAADTTGFCGEVKSTVCGPAAPVAYDVGASPVACLAADFDEDGVLDLATADSGGDRVSVLRGQGANGAGDGTFAAAVGTALPAGSHPTALACDDFDGDGILDLAVAVEEAAGVTLLFGGGTGGVGDGTFIVGPRLAVGAGPRGLATGDFDADGVSDLAVACDSGRVSILIGQGADGVPDGTFAPAMHVAVGSTLYAVATGDFDEDGITDLAAAGDGGLHVLRGQGAAGRGDGTFAAPVTYACQSLPFALATGDFDADGATDLAVVNSGSGSVSVLPGGGDGTFGPPAHHACGASPNGIVTGDWNGDGATDLAVTNRDTTVTLTILAGRPDGDFRTAQAFPAGTRPRTLTAGDFDHDGQTDLVVIHDRDPGTVAVLRSACPSPLPASLRVTRPAGGEQWVTGAQQALAWSRAPGVLAVDVALSRDGGADWHTLARGVTDTTWTWNVTGPYTTQARIRVADPAVPGRAAACDTVFTIVPAGLFDAGGAPRGALALRGVWPNPTGGTARVWFTLASDEPARLELLDLAGRRVRSLELGGRKAGLHHVDLAETSLRPGLYLLRLSQAGRRASGKVVVTR